MTLNINQLNPFEKLDRILSITNRQRDYYDLLFVLGQDLELDADEYTLKLILSKLGKGGYVDYIYMGRLVNDHDGGNGVSIRSNFTRLSGRSVRNKVRCKKLTMVVAGHIAEIADTLNKKNVWDNGIPKTIDFLIKKQSILHPSRCRCAYRYYKSYKRKSLLDSEKRCV